MLPFRLLWKTQSSNGLQFKLKIHSHWTYVEDVLLKAFYSFGNSQKHFCAWVFMLYNKFADFFSKAAVNFIYIVLLSTNKNQ